jgi:hypothetical protein
MKNKKRIDEPSRKNKPRKADGQPSRKKKKRKLEVYC